MTRVGWNLFSPISPVKPALRSALTVGPRYAYSTPDNAGTYSISPLTEGRYQVFVRHGAGAAEVYMGEVFIGNSVEIPPSVASEPYPADGEEGVRTELTLGWKEGEQVQSHTIYLGTSSPPDSVASQASATYKPGRTGAQYHLLLADR